MSYFILSSKPYNPRSSYVFPSWRLYCETRLLKVSFKQVFLEGNMRGDYPKGQGGSTGSSIPRIHPFPDSRDRRLGTRPLCWCRLSCFLKAGAQLHRALYLLRSGDVPVSVHHPYLLHSLLATCILKFRYKSGSCYFEIYVFFFLFRSCMLGMSNWKKYTMSIFLHYISVRGIIYSQHYMEKHYWLSCLCWYFNDAYFLPQEETKFHRLANMSIFDNFCD